MRPGEALKLLTVFERKFTQLKSKRDKISKAHEVLEIAKPGLFQLQMTSLWLTIIKLCKEIQNEQNMNLFSVER